MCGRSFRFSLIWGAWMSFILPVPVLLGYQQSMHTCDCVFFFYFTCSGLVTKKVLKSESQTVSIFRRWSAAASKIDNIYFPWLAVLL